jgi:hypothetical protein
MEAEFPKLLLAGGLLVLLCLPGAAIAAWAGPQYGLVENPPSLVLSSSPGALDQLQQTAVGLAFDSERSEYIVAEQSIYPEGSSGELQILSTSGAVTGSWSANCSGQVSGLFYTGGSNAFISCSWRYNSTLLEFNLTQNRFTSVSGTAFWGGFRTFVTNPQQTVGYFATWADTLGSVDLQTGAVTANVSLPGAAPPLLFDNRTGQLLYGDTGNSSIGVVDPANMSLVRLVPTAGNISAFGQDPDSGEIFVSYYSDPNESLTGTEVLNGTSLNEIAHFSSPAWYYPFFDASRGELYLTDGVTVDAVSLSPLGLPLGSFGIDSGVPLPVLAAYDPTSDQLAVASLSPPTDRAGLAEIHHDLVSAPAYSAVPVAGTASPIAVGVGMFLAGFALLLVRDRRQIRIAKELERRRGLMR